MELIDSWKYTGLKGETIKRVRSVLEVPISNYTLKILAYASTPEPIASSESSLPVLPTRTILLMGLVIR